MKGLMRKLFAGAVAGVVIGITTAYINTGIRVAVKAQPLVERKSREEQIMEAEDTVVRHFYDIFKIKSPDRFLEDELFFIEDRNTFDSYSEEERREVIARMAAIMAAIEYLNKYETLGDYGIERSGGAWIVDTTKMNIVWAMRMKYRR